MTNDLAERRRSLLCISSTVGTYCIVTKHCTEESHHTPNRRCLLQPYLTLAAHRLLIFLLNISNLYIRPLGLELQFFLKHIIKCCRHSNVHSQPLADFMQHFDIHMHTKNIINFTMFLKQQQKLLRPFYWRK